MIKKFLLLTTVLLAGLAANAATSYGFEVAGTAVTSDNCNNITNSYITSGTVYYDPSNNTLFIKNATINCTGSYKRAINNTSNSDLIVMFQGTCTLKAKDAAAIRVSKNTTLWAPQASTTVNIIGMDEEAIYMAINYTTLDIKGPGKFIISGDKKPALAGKLSTSTDAPTELADSYYVNFEDVKAQLSCSQDNVTRRVFITFKAGSSVRFKATNNASYSVITRTNMYFEGNEALLEPYGAYVSNSATPHDGPTGTVYESDGSRVINHDIYISDDYVAIINATYFPDANFRNILLSRYFSKGYITSTDVAGCGSLSPSGCNISNLKGIEYFTNLTSLDCSNNNLTSLDLSHNTQLVDINCLNNKLTSLNVSNMKALITLKCGGNLLTSLNVNGCTALQFINCAANKFTSLSITGLYNNLKTLECYGNTSLTELDCHHNNLTTLNVTDNTALKKLQCYENANLTSITGLTDCKAITYFDCEDCSFTDLSALANMVNIEKVYARNNKLTSLTLTGKSKLTYMRLYGNKQLTTLYCYNNALTTLDIQGCTALESLNCYSNNNLATITGLADCKAVKVIRCYDCALTTLDGVDGMNNLLLLNCHNNKLTSLIVTNKNNLGLIDCSNNKQLTSINCYNNAVTTFEVSGCTGLKSLTCTNNSSLATITGLADCKAIEYLQCFNCALTSLDGVNVMNDLTTLECYGNKLTTLTVTNKSKLTRLNCSNNKQLTTLDCYSNGLTSLTVIGCSALTDLWCHDNKLTSLTVPGCDALKGLYCHTNKISGENMTNLVNSLPMRSTDNYGNLFVLYNNNEENTINDDQLNIAAGKYWIPRKWNGSTWEEITSSSGGLLGDFDNSKVIDVEDVNAAINIILKIKTMADYPGNGDMDNNGFIDVEDVNAIINIILKQ